ncbi:hypothetical protein GCM10017044_15210 [Kordiimonas sediminis]|uniref:NAD(P)-binding domain-containing protein n=1 Tax=Kordiimonas sediminis TaxID=1735581 RepID=A0A919ARX3_9PROT|nr:NAD(P)H-binding protein [Kordiimonas sediminis]GHF21212.1 hypothetical protein GCM10017044_15210 [Kordiimonas sediminis]
MKILIIGSTGDIGQRVSAEAISRKHTVLGMIRSEHKSRFLVKGVIPIVGTAEHTATVLQIHPDIDLIISAVRPPAGQEHILPDLTTPIMQASAKHNTRLIISGGAARLIIPGTGGMTVLSQPGFLPDSVVPIAKASMAQYEQFNHARLSIWSYASPSGNIYPGVRTGHYQLGQDELLQSKAGLSQISMEDFAVALLDEAENPGFAGKAFTVVDA